VEKNRKGFAFLLFENKKMEDAFVPPRDAERLFHGDRVEVTLGHNRQPEKIQVLEHRYREIVGRFMPQPNSGKGKKLRDGWVIYEKKRAREEVFVMGAPEDVTSGDWVRAKLHFHEVGPYYTTAEILDRYGKDLPASADISMIAAEYNLEEHHSKAAEDEAKRQKLEIPGKDLEGRVDLRSTPFITIDGETARDFDDAVYVERNKSGFILWVAIADVSHYVKPGHPLDETARSRGTSVYFPERAFHMLPRALSENLCSLRPNEPRLSMVARIEMDRNGVRLSTEVMNAVIQSKRRATYTEIQKEWEANTKNKDWEFTPHFSLYQLLRKMRSDRGSIDFELPEAEVVVEPNGTVVSIKHRPRLDTHRLIEEFMIAANEAVTDWMMEKQWPFVYRIHDEPSAQSLENFQALAATVGVKVSFEQSTAPKVMADIVRRLAGTPAESLLNMALLRSMKQAVYSSLHGIHYGLASPGYTHFTSPIRRYPDLVVHRLLKMKLLFEQKEKSQLEPKERESLENELAQICEHCSYRERLAADAERESIKLKQVRAIAKNLGDEFDSKIVGMIAAGVFVQILDPYVEGMVPVESMGNDLYEFDDKKMVFFGRKKKKVLRIGDPLRVRAVRADVERRQIDFTVVDAPQKE
jgi:ribonuclease R